MRTSLCLLALALVACSKQPAPAARTDVVTGPICDSLACADRNRIQGPGSAKVWLVIASDFECPYCKMFHDQAYQQIVSDYVGAGKVQVAFLNHPMTSLHRHALVSAEAAMCAALQGRFWQMHDSLFAAQGRWAPLDDPVPAFVQLATGVGLQVPAFRTCMQTHKTLPLVDADNARTSKSGVKGTPSFILMLKSAPAEGHMAVEGVAPFTEFKRILDSALAKAGSP